MLLQVRAPSPRPRLKDIPCPRSQWLDHHTLWTRIRRGHPMERRAPSKEDNATAQATNEASKGQWDQQQRNHDHRLRLR